MEVKHFYDPGTYTLTYVIYETGDKDAIIIDPVMDINTNSGKLSDHSVKKVIAFLENERLNPVYCLETHAHADHITGSQLLKERYPEMRVAISERIKGVQEVFTEVFNNKDEVATDGSQFDYLLKDFEEINAAGLTLKVIPTPGHTPACTSFLINDAVFTGDAIFVPDSGTGRCDFPKGSASDLYDSITKNLYTLDDSTRVFVGHDYQPGGRELAFETTIGDLKQKNNMLPAKRSKEEFIATREERDRTLDAPHLLLPSIQVNIRAGHLPKPEDNGRVYLKLPLTLIR